VRSVPPSLSIRAIDQSGSPTINHGPRLLNRLLKRIPVYKYEVEYDGDFRILKHFENY
jgi:hypothetical protein